MTKPTHISSDALYRYQSIFKCYTNKDFLPDGQVVSGEKKERKISWLLANKFEVIDLALRGEFTEQQKGKLLFDEAYLPNALHIKQKFDEMTKQLLAADKDPSQCPTVQDVRNVFEDMYFMLMRKTPYNDYLRELIVYTMEVLEMDAPYVPRQAFEGAGIPQLAAYVEENRCVNYAMWGDKIVRGRTLVSFGDVLHNWIGMGAVAAFALRNEFEITKQKWPIKEGITEEQAWQKAEKLRTTIVTLENTNYFRDLSPSENWVKQVFSDFHNMLLPTTVQNRCVRTMIEKVLDAIGIDDSLLDERSAAHFAEDERTIPDSRPRESRSS